MIVESLMANYLSKIQYRLRDLIDYMRAFRKVGQSNFRVEETVGDDFLVAAKKLHAKVYLDRGFVADQDIADGIITLEADPHQLHSRYFVVINNKTSRMVATARQIEVRPGRGHDSFAAIEKANINKNSLRMILKQDPKRVIEISGLAKERGVSKIAPLLLYRAMWHHSIKEQHLIWILASDVRLFIRLKLLFGHSITKIGRKTPYYGGDVVPAVLKVQDSITDLKKSLEKAKFFERPLRHRIVRFMLSGIPVEYLNTKEKESLRQIVKKYAPFYSSIRTE